MMFFFCFLLWIILNGRITVEIVLIGLVVAGGVTYLARSLIGGGQKERLKMHNVPLLLLYMLVLVREIVLAALSVIRVAFSRKTGPDPVLVEFHSGLSSEVRNVLLANSITLTPGTYTLRQDGDHFVVHCLRKEYAEGMEDSAFVRLLKKMH